MPNASGDLVSKAQVWTGLRLIWQHPQIQPAMADGQAAHTLSISSCVRAFALQSDKKRDLAKPDADITIILKCLGPQIMVKNGVERWRSHQSVTEDP